MAKKKGNSWNRQGTQSFRKCYGKKSSAKQTVAPKFLIDSTILRCENCNNQFWSLPVGDFHPWPMIRRKTHRFGVPTSLHATWPDLTNQPTNQPSPYPALMPSPCHLQGSLWWFQKKWWTREKAKKPVENWAEKISQHQKIPWSLPPTTVAFFLEESPKAEMTSTFHEVVDEAGDFCWHFALLGFLCIWRSLTKMQVATFQVPCLPICALPASTA